MKADYLGGLVTKINLAPLRLTECVTPLGGRIADAFNTRALVRLRNGWQWETLAFPDRALSFSEETEQTPNGIVYAAQVSGAVAGGREIQELVSGYLCEEFLCIAEYKNGVRRLLGDMQNGCILETQAEVSAGILVNEINLTIKCQMSHSCWYM